MVTFFEESPFLELIGIRLCEGPGKAAKFGWVQGVLFTDPECMFLVGWDDVEAMKNGVITAGNWRDHRFSDTKSRIVKPDDIQSIQVGGGALKARHIHMTLTSGGSFSFILSTDFDENPSKKAYKEFTSSLSETWPDLAAKIATA